MCECFIYMYVYASNFPGAYEAQNRSPDPGAKIIDCCELSCEFWDTDWILYKRRVLLTAELFIQTLYKLL